MMRIFTHQVVMGSSSKKEKEKKMWLLWDSADQNVSFILLFTLIVWMHVNLIILSSICIKVTKFSVIIYTLKL